MNITIPHDIVKSAASSNEKNKRPKRKWLQIQPVEGERNDAHTKVQESLNQSFKNKDDDDNDEDDNGDNDDDQSPIYCVDGTKYLYNALRFLGIHPPGTYRLPYFIYSILLNGIATIYFPISFVISYVNMTEADLAAINIFTSIQVGMNVFACSAKFIVIAIMLTKLRTAHVVMEQLDARGWTQPDERAELKKLVRLGNRLFVYLCLLYYSFSTSTLISAVLEGRPPYAIHNPFADWRASRIQFAVATFFEFVLINITCLQQVVNDSYAVIYVCILRCHLQMLFLRISKWASNNSRSDEYNLQELKSCIKDHKSLIELYNIISPVISSTIFVQFMVTALLLGITLINITIFSTDFTARAASVFYFIAVCMEIYPLCYYTQCLMNDNDRLSGIIFHSNWVDQNACYRQMLIFYMQRSQRTMEFTAGKIFPITLNSFISIAKFSFTLYTFIKEMGVKEKLGLD